MEVVFIKIYLTTFNTKVNQDILKLTLEKKSYPSPNKISFHVLFVLRIWLDNKNYVEFLLFSDALH
jgi:hypothetical protein